MTTATPEFVPPAVAALLADPEARYRVAGWDGVAFYAHGPEAHPDEDTEWTGYTIPTGRVLVCMVGDDQLIPADPDDLTRLDDGEWCASCGQTGCGWGS